MTSSTVTSTSMITTSTDMYCCQKPYTKKCQKENCLERMSGEVLGKIIRVQQSRGWIHYDIHKPEPFILLF